MTHCHILTQLMIYSKSTENLTYIFILFIKKTYVVNINNSPFLTENVNFLVIKCIFLHLLYDIHIRNKG